MAVRNVKKKNIKRKENRLPMIITSVVLVVLVVLVVVIDLSAPAAYTMYNSDAITYEKGTVTAVMDERLEPAPGMPGRELGQQKIAVRLRSGNQKGQVIEVDNNLSVTHNIYVRNGQSVIIKADRPEGVTPYYTVYNYDRTPGLVIVAVIFVALMLLVGKIKGLRSVLGFGLSLFFIMAFLIPAIYRGWSPVWMSILTVVIISAFSLLLLNGFSNKTLTAVAATVAGVAFSAAFYFIISAVMHLAGYDITEADELILISQNTGLHIGQVLFASVLVASLGAVMDTAISMSAALYEIKAVQPDIAPRSLFKSGIAVGRDMIGANCQTLILAFVGSSLATLLVLVSYGTQFDQFLSSNYLAVEVVHGITGSIAVILAVPITAALFVLLAGPWRTGKNARQAN